MEKDDTHTHTADATTAYSQFQQWIQVKKEISWQKPHLVVGKRSKPETQGDQKKMYIVVIYQSLCDKGSLLYCRCNKVSVLQMLHKENDSRLTDESNLADLVRHFWWSFQSCSLQWICHKNRGLSKQNTSIRNKSRA